MEPTKPKVKAAAAGGGIGGLVATFIIWLIGASVWDGGWNAEDVARSIAAVPAPITALIVAVVPAVISWAAGYWQRDQFVHIDGTTQQFERDPGHNGEHRAKDLGDWVTPQ